MRRALLLLTLLAPAFASAQASGQIMLINNRTFPNYVNAAECAGGTVNIRFNAAPVNGSTGFQSQGVYYLFAQNQPVNTSANTSTGTSCQTANVDASGLVVLSVTSTSTAAGLVADFLVSGNQLIAGSTGNIATCSGGDQTIYLCVQGVAPGSTMPFALATGSLIVSTTSPPAPVIGSATPGDGALNVSWGPGTATSLAPANVQEYSLEATPVTTGADTVHDSGRISGSPHRFGGLVNGVVYSVRATAYSIADNPSDPSDAVTGMPEAVRDFWDLYKFEGGKESGGCSTGFAGPIGLGVLIATLALVRRRK